MDPVSKIFRSLQLCGIQLQGGERPYSLALLLLLLCSSFNNCGSVVAQCVFCRARFFVSLFIGRLSGLFAVDPVSLGVRPTIRTWRFSSWEYSAPVGTRQVVIQRGGNRSKLPVWRVKFRFIFFTLYGVEEVASGRVVLVVAGEFYERGVRFLGVRSNLRFPVVLPNGNGDLFQCVPYNSRDLQGVFDRASNGAPTANSCVRRANANYDFFRCRVGRLLDFEAEGRRAQDCPGREPVGANFTLGVLSQLIFLRSFSGTFWVALLIYEWYCVFTRVVVGDVLARRVAAGSFYRAPRFSQ